MKKGLSILPNKGRDSPNFIDHQYFSISGRNFGKTKFASMNAKFLQDNSQFPFDSTKIRGHFNEISRRIFFEISRNKERKSEKIAFISFVQYCKFNLGDDVFETIRTQLVSIDLLKHIENQIILTIWWTGKRAQWKNEVGTLYDVSDQHLLLYTLTALLSLYSSLYYRSPRMHKCVLII